jgi:signal transduction histidine kinase
MSHTFPPRADSAGARGAAVKSAAGVRDSGAAALRYGLRVSSDLRRVLPALLPVTLAGAGLVIAAAVSFALDHPSMHTIAGVVALLAASITAEAFPVPIEGVAAGRTSLATIFIVGTAVEYGWAPAALVGFGTMFVIEVARRRGPMRIPYNASLYTLGAGAAGAADALVPGHDVLSLAAAAVFGSTWFYIVDIALLTAVITRSRHQPFFAWWRRAMASTVLPFAVMASLTVILVVLWSRSPFVAIALVGPLVVIALYQRRVHGVLESLRELDRLKNEFIAVVSHELRTPITSVYGAAVTLEQTKLDPAQRESLLRVVYSEASRLVRLVDQVLWASRVETARGEPVIESCDAEQLAETVVKAAQTHLPANLTLELRVEGRLPPVAADPEKANQVLVNLVENAVKYSPNGGRIEVTLSRVGDHVRFAVRDEGLGIREEDQERIFEKFERLDPDLARGVSGTGLGLFISRELAAQMNGTLSVESRPGQGSTFALDLPVA